MARTSFHLVPICLRTLVVRFAALWIALIIAIALPPSREMLRFHIVGSDVVPQFYNWDQPWNDHGDDLDLAPLLKKEPNNAALAYWNLRSQSEQNDDYYPNSKQISVFSNSELFKLSKKFPESLWLKALAIQAYACDVPNQVEYSPASTTTYAPVRVIKAPEIPNDKYLLVQNCAKFEPDNAFWPVCEAYFRIHEMKYDEANRLLTRAAKCRLYDDKTLEATRELIRVQSRFRPLAWEETKVLYEDNNEENPFSENLKEAMQTLSTLSLGGRRYSQKLQVSTNLMRIGALMQRGNNSLAVCRNGMALQNLAWRLGNPAGKTFQFLPKGHLSFAKFVQKRGYSALANETLKLKKESETIESWAFQKNSESWGFTPIYLNAGGLAARANTVRDGGAFLVAFFSYLVLWWHFLNIFLFRGKGIASTRRERIVPVLVFAALFLVIAGIAGWWFTLAWNASSPRSPRRDEVMVSVGVFAFAGLPFVLAIFCALATMRRYKSEFTLPPRIDMELQLSSFYRNLLRWMLPFMVVCSIGTLIIGWLFFALAVMLDLGRINILAWLPADRNGVRGDISFHPIYEPYPLVYGLIMCAVCIGVWFLKWRFFSPKDLKVFTHTGLRRWKETIGIAIVTTVGIYITGSVLMWPTRLQLDHRMEQVLAKGPLSQRTK